MWSAEAADGFDLGGDVSGQFSVVACDDEVLDEVIENDDPDDEVLDVVVLPFTGMDTGTLFGASVVLLGMGVTLVSWARRREDG
jgi:hypothetical protein